VITPPVPGVRSAQVSVHLIYADGTAAQISSTLIVSNPRIEAIVLSDAELLGAIRQGAREVLGVVTQSGGDGIFAIIANPIKDSSKPFSCN
jgi:hypothetical protein